MHFVTDAVTAPLFWELWNDSDNPEAREAYGATSASSGCATSCSPNTSAKA